VFSSWFVPLDRVGGQECSPHTSAIKLRHPRRLRLVPRGADPAAQLFQREGFVQETYVEINDLVVGKSFSGVAEDEPCCALRTAAILRSSERGSQKLTLGPPSEGRTRSVYPIWEASQSGMSESSMPPDLQLCRNRAEPLLPKAKFAFVNQTPARASN
jgi:hypothetical protein